MHISESVLKTGPSETDKASNCYVVHFHGACVRAAPRPTNILQLQQEKNTKPSTVSETGTGTGVAHLFGDVSSWKPETGLLPSAIQQKCLLQPLQRWQRRLCGLGADGGKSSGLTDQSAGSSLQQPGWQDEAAIAAASGPRGRRRWRLDAVASGALLSGWHITVGMLVLIPIAHRHYLRLMKTLNIQEAMAP